MHKDASGLGTLLQDTMSDTGSYGDSGSKGLDLEERGLRIVGTTQGAAVPACPYRNSWSFTGVDGCPSRGS